ncbi:MAG: TIM barrel protein [Fuerstiella sp.]|nr:TIM barrel protein [Fuerstiella sp.]
MQLSTVLTPESDENLALAAQCGVTQIVSRYPGPTLEHIRRRKQHFAHFNLNLTVIEGYLPIENIKVGSDDGTELAALKQLVRNMGEVGIPILCYNFMAGTDWVRTRLDAPERGGARVTGFDLADAQKAVLLGHDEDALKVPENGVGVSVDELWTNLESMLREVLPVAESAGVTLAMHPDDPPLAEFGGRARIMNSLESFERLVRLVPSDSNGVCFCQGTFVEMGVDVPAAIRKLGDHIRYVHFRDVRGNAESFTETFHDNGPTDMAEAMRAYRDIGFDGPIRPDHVPQLEGDHGEPGYTTPGRLFAWGYLRGLMQATEPR